MVCIGWGGVQIDQAETAKEGRRNTRVNHKLVAVVMDWLVVVGRGAATAVAGEQVDAAPVSDTEAAVGGLFMAAGRQTRGVSTGPGWPRVCGRPTRVLSTGGARHSTRRGASGTCGHNFRQAAPREAMHS